MTGDFARRLAALGIDRRALLSYLHRVGPLPARELAIAAHLPLGMVLALLPELRRAGFVTWRAGCWRLSHAAELHAADTRPQDRAEPEPMPGRQPDRENAATARPGPADTADAPATAKRETIFWTFPQAGHARRDARAVPDLPKWVNAEGAPS